jgi:hypothetical protein
MGIENSDGTRAFSFSKIEKEGVHYFISLFKDETNATIDVILW